MRASLRFTLSVALGALIAACSGSGSSPAPATHRSAATAAAFAAGIDRSGHVAVLLPDGNVLLAGGREAGATQAQTFDPATGLIQNADVPIAPRIDAAAVVMPDGTVMIVGGEDASGTPLDTTLFYDPLLRTFSDGPALNDARTALTATRLSTGAVVVVGGRGLAGVLATTEIYTPPASEGGPASWQPGPDLLAARAHHTTTLLADDSLLVVGGEDDQGHALSTDVAERNGADVPGAAPRTRHTATLLPGGDVLVVGGQDDGGALQTADLYGGGSFTPSTPPHAARAGHTATLLPEGQVVIAGGQAGGAVTSVEVYDPSLDGYAIATETADRVGAAATLLPSGRVLLTGGGSGNPGLLDKATDAWATPAVKLPSSGPVPQGRQGHTATVLVTGTHAGMVLLVGGIDSEGGYLNSAQLYDPTQRKLLNLAIPAMASARVHHTATLLQSGKVLVTGGTTGTTTLDSAQIYDPVGNGWSAVFHMSAKRAYHTATALPSGQVLVAGGEDDGTDLGTAELFTESPAAPGGSFAVTAGPMTAMRSHHAAALLQDGSVLLTGGDAAGAVLRSTEIYGVDGMFTAAGDMTATRAGHTATPLLSGEVLVVGGRDAGGAPLGSAELYRPGSRDFSASPSGTVLPRADHAASILPGGLVLIAGGADENGESLQDARQYDPAANRFSLADGLTLGRALETATLLPDGTVLAYGGAGRRPPDELVDLYSAVSPAAGRPTPDLTSVDQTRVPGGDLHLAGVALLGGFEASGGAAQSSAVNHPVIELVRAGGDGQARAAITQLADGTATARLPKTLLPGWWWARMVTAGVPGKALPFRVYPPFDITPQDPTTCFPRGTIDFTVSGGAGGPYTWSWASPPASGLGADISAGGHYVAGANGSTPAVDVVKVTDAGGNDSLVHITVGVGISISVVPVSAEITTRGHAQFSASGGDGGPYGWAVTTAASGAATIDASGAYTAGSTPGVDTIQVTDALGNTATATITVDRPLTIDPQGPLELFPGEAQHFVTDGGSGKSLAWTITPNGSGAGAVVLSDPEGVAADYTAGRTGNSDDTLHVQDSVGNFVIVSIHVKPGITIDPFTAPPPGGSIGFTAQGGTGDGWVWDFAPGGNRSGASIDPGTGAYTAGHTGSVTDVVMVTDRLQNVATAQVAVGPGITISPVEPGAYPGGTVTLTATGGSGAGYTWTIETLRSGTGSITTAADGTGVYQAGSVRGAIDVVKVVDSLGNEATVDVAVWPDWQAKGSGCSSGGGNGAAGLLALALLLALRARPRLRRALARAGAAGLGLLALVGAARAQTPTPPATTSFVVQRFQPSGGAFDVLTVESAQTAGRLAGSIQLWGNYGHRPLIVVAPGVKDAALLKSQTGLDLALSLGLTDWAEVSAVVPFTASQSREENRLLPPDLRPAIASSGLGDVRLVPKVRLVDYRALRLGVAVPISFPTGKKDSYLGHGALTYAPKALVELDGLGPVRLLLNGGAIFREDRELVALTVGNAYTYGAGLEWALGQQFAALASFAGEAGMKDRSAAARPMEALGALRWQALGGLHFTVGGGPGVGDGYGTPQYRVFAELGYTGADHRRLDRREPPPKPEPVVAKQEEPKPEPVKAEEPKPEPKAEPVPDKVEVPAEEEVPAPEVVNGELRIDARIYFAFNRKELRPQFEPVLDQIAQRIVAEPRMKMVRIEGHADDLGPPEYNVWLSLERAKVVQAFLVHHGVPAKRVVIVGYGKMHPAEKGKSKASRAKNRRVEFNVQER